MPELWLFPLVLRDDAPFPMSRMLRFTKEDLARHMNKVNARHHAANKFNAKRVEVDGFTFDSKKESNRYAELKMLLVAGQITDLKVHPEYEFHVNGIQIGKYTPDFRYWQQGRQKVEDVKSKATKTEAYGIRKRLMLALHGIEIEEV